MRQSDISVPGSHSYVSVIRTQRVGHEHTHIVEPQDLYGCASRGSARTSALAEVLQASLVQAQAAAGRLLARLHLELHLNSHSEPATAQVRRDVEERHPRELESVR